MLTDRSFVLTIPSGPDALAGLRGALRDQLPAHVAADEDVLLVAGLLVRQAQAWQGAEGPVRLRTSTLGQVVNLEVNRDVPPDQATGPGNEDAFHGVLEVLTRCADRFIVSTFPGCVSLSAQKLIDPLGSEIEIDLRVAA